MFSVFLLYRNQVVLIVNVASKWGFTDKNYTQLQKLHEKYAEEKGLRILGFPCNQFGSQVSKLVHRFNTIEAEIVTEGYLMRTNFKHC